MKIKALRDIVVGSAYYGPDDIVEGTNEALAGYIDNAYAELVEADEPAKKTTTKKGE